MTRWICGVLALLAPLSGACGSDSEPPPTRGTGTTTTSSVDARPDAPDFSERDGPVSPEDLDDVAPSGSASTTTSAP